MKEAELEALKSAITNPDELFYKGVLYGEFGTRKTTSALRCSRSGAILLHADRGWNVIHNHPDEFKNVIPVEYQGLSQFKSLLAAVAEGVSPFDNKDLIVVDTISQVQENYVDFLMENAQYKGNFRESLIPKQGVKNFEATEIPGMPDYHLARNKLRPIIHALVKAPINVIFLAHTREPSPIERAAGKIERRPNLTEAAYKILAREATFIGYMERKKENYTIDFTPKNTQSAKSQIPSLTDKQIQASELPEHLHKWQNK